MEQFLKYFYDIYIDNIYKKDNKYYFYKDNSLFCVTKNYRLPEELKDILGICYEMQSRFPVSQIVFNKFGQISSDYDNNNYILLKINTSMSSDITINDIIKINNSLFLNKDKKELYRNNWAKLWESKVDYFEYQIKELGRNKKIILNSFSYYIGLAENAISIANICELYNKDNMNEKVVLSHRRINYPCMEYEFYNPLEYIFDIQVRDISEYLKSMFFYTDRNHTIKELKNYLLSTRLSNYEANMLYARLLYPTYYFDIYEKVIEDLEEESELLDIINKVDEYELFLKEAYFELSRMHKIEQINWIINKKEL